MVKPAGPFLAPGAPGKALLHRKGHSSTPRTKTYPFTPAHKDHAPGTPSPWGPRTGGTLIVVGIAPGDRGHPPKPF